MTRTKPVKEASTPTGGPRNEGAKRAQILVGASRVFLRQGFDAASMDEIAREAGVSKGTLYVYFKSKEELFETIVEDQCSDQAEAIFSFDHEATLEQELGRLGTSFVHFLCQPGAVPSIRTIVAIADRMPEIGARFYASGPARGITALKGYLGRKMDEGVLAPHDTELAAAQFIELCLATTYKPMLFNAAGPPSDGRISYVVGRAVKVFIAAYGKT